MSEAEDHEHDPDDAMVTDNRWGTREVEITAVRLLDDSGNQHTSFATGGGLTVAVDYVVHADLNDFVFGLAFKRSDGINISGPNTRTANCRVTATRPGTRGTMTYSIPHLGLLGAKYVVTAAVYDGFLNRAFDHIEDVVSFRVVDEKGRLGMVDLGGTWEQSLEGESRAYGRAG